MSKLQVAQMIRVAAIAAFVAVSGAPQGFAQETVPPHMNLHHRAAPWSGGTPEDAVMQAASGATIPMSRYAVDNGKGGNAYGVLVGGDPFAALPSTVTIDAVLIPLIVEIISEDGSVTVFDPTKPNSCDGGQSAEYSFNHSPLVVASESDLIFNGVRVGKVQYINGFMKAEFWNATATSKNLDDPIRWSSAPAYTLLPFVSPTDGIVQVLPVIQGCGERAIVSLSQLQFFIEGSIIPILQAEGVISPTKFALFLTENVIASLADPVTTTGPQCCAAGYHNAIGSPVQTYAWANYDATGTGAPDVAAASHEIAEWMNDPLGTNLTPAWGNIGQVSGCPNTLEVGDPLTGTYMPAIRMNGRNYYAQEMAFFDWFFNADSIPSSGAGGKFSGNGFFTGPSKACPPGGTYH